ncbi:hypothetical protein G7077_10800 [Sphingomonas piscis]|uniref:Uncharacterized protein n=1 Tax=Sphingomonas piscis TaxID=2714943 RepID=A0A6G7YRE6_9SPHN|nr:hypothetical protein [Sphingomonas piscis]QIK79318.1 hypothetical protein G7077_10800 [Sphingomonas piscis]
MKTMNLLVKWQHRIEPSSFHLSDHPHMLFVSYSAVASTLCILAIMAARALLGAT